MAALILDDVEIRTDRDDIIGWMSDWSAVHGADWQSRGLVESIPHNSGGLGGASYRLTAAGRGASRNAHTTCPGCGTAPAYMTRPADPWDTHDVCPSCRYCYTHAD